MTPRPPTSDPVEIEPGVHLLPEGALWLPDEGLLAVSDLHLGYDAHYRHAGALVPEYGTDALLERLDGLLDRYGPRTLLVNGDVKHAFTRHLLEEKRALERLEALVRNAGARLVPVRGNHDGYLERMLASEVVDEHRAGPCRFAHGHAMVTREPGDLLILGHEHPAISLRDEVGVRVRLPAALHHPGARILVLPALSPWAAGYEPMTSGRFLGPNLQGLRPGEFDAYAFQDGVTYPFGNLERLSRALR